MQCTRHFGRAGQVTLPPKGVAVQKLPCLQSSTSNSIHGARNIICKATASDIDFVEGVSAQEAERFERIAASLAARAGDIKDAEEPTDDELLVSYGATHEQVALLQAKLNAQRERSTQAAQEPSTSSSSLVNNTPRKQRKRQIPTEYLPKVAIVGRPNVGKSAMFNRLAGTSLAVVYDEPGVTRDRLYTRAFWGDKEYVLIDTGGLMSDATRLPPEVVESAMQSISADGLPSAIERQAAAGVAEADSLVLLVDGQAGLQSGDREILSWLRQNHPQKPVVLAVNKCENTVKSDLMVSDFWELGLTPMAVSAITGTGTGELLDSLMVTLPPPKSLEEADTSDAPLSIAIVGRPNVGKSSLLNAICGEERSIVCDMSGTTRDAVDTEVTLPSGQRLTLIDTAGIRKRTKVADSKDGAEQLSVDRALRAMRRAEIVVIVIDGSEGITQQDFKLSELAAAEGRAAVVVVNKWDRVDQRKWTPEKYTEEVRSQLRHVAWASVVCTTAVEGRRVDEVVEAVLGAGREHRRRVSTATLNMVVREATAWKAPPTQRRSLRKGKIYYATQAGTQPPTFVFFVNDIKLFSDDYKRYMERQLRDNIGFPGSPLRLLWRGKPEQERGLVRVNREGQAGGKSSGSKRSGPPKRYGPSKPSEPSKSK